LIRAYSNELFDSKYRLESPLSNFNEESLNGKLKLMINDSSAGKERI